MFVSPLGSAGSSRSASPRLSGVSELMRTPKQKQRQSFDLVGVKTLLKTPKELKSPQLSGVNQLMKTPRRKKSAKDVAGTPRLDGVRELMKSPKRRSSPELTGVRQLMKTPRAQKSPALDGMRTLVRTPKEVAGTPELGGIRRLVKTPKVQKSPSLSGIKKLVKTPKATKSPQLAGLKTLVRTPKQLQSPALAGLRQLMKTPKSGPKSPDFVGMSEMLTSPLQASGAVSVEGSQPKNNRVSFAVSPLLSPKVPGIRGRKTLKKTPEAELEVLEVGAGKLSRRKRGGKFVDEVDVIISKKPKLSKFSAETEMTESQTDGRNDIEVTSSPSVSGSSASRRGKSRAVVAPKETGVAVSKYNAAKASSTPVAKTRKKMSKSDVSEAVGESVSQKTSVRSNARNTRTSKTVDAGTLSTSASMDQVVTRRKAVKASEVAEAKKSTKKSARNGQTAKSTTKVEAELITLPDIVVDDSVSIAQQVGGKKSRTTRKQPVMVDIDHDRSVEIVQVDEAVQSKGSRRAKKAVAAVNSESKAETGDKNVKMKELHVDLSSDKPVAGRRGKPSKVEQFEAVPSMQQHDNSISAKSPMSTRRGKRQVAVSVSHTAAASGRKQQKGKESPAAGRRGKHRSGHEEPQQAVENSKVTTPSHRRKRQQTEDRKESDVESAIEKPVRGRKGKQSATEQPESYPSSTEPAKLLVSVRRGKRQVTVQESLPVAENVQQKGLNRAGGRRGKRDEQQAIESSQVMMPSRSRKRPQANDEQIDVPVSKRQGQTTEQSLVTEQPMEKATRQRGKRSAVSEPVELGVQSATSEKKTEPKKINTRSKSTVKKSGGKQDERKLSVEVAEDVSGSLKKSGRKNAAKKLKVEDKLSNYKLKGYGERKDTEIAVVSPAATRSKRTKRQ